MFVTATKHFKMHHIWFPHGLLRLFFIYFPQLSFSTREESQWWKFWFECSVWLVGLTLGAFVCECVCVCVDVLRLCANDWCVSDSLSSSDREQDQFSPFMSFSIRLERGREGITLNNYVTNEPSNSSESLYSDYTSKHFLSSVQWIFFRALNHCLKLCC